MLTSDFDYVLPPERIAQEAIEPRDSARLLLSNHTSYAHKTVADLDSILAPNDLLVFNNTKVFPARLFAKKETGGQVEVLLIHPVTSDNDKLWLCMIRGKVREGTLLFISETNDKCIQLQVITCRDDGQRELLFPVDCDIMALCDAVGHIPLPPYIQRDDRPDDKDRYQCVYADTPGSVAAPTAGLHFTTDLLQRLQNVGVQSAFVELRVGPGTFKPVEAESVEDHQIHSEWCSCPQETVTAIANCKSNGGRVIAVGTTVVRTLESAAACNNGTIQTWNGWTQIFLHPPIQPQVADGLLTNFHLPKSSLLMLLACYTGLERMHEIYAEAIAQQYRFYSYGDAMLWLP